MMPQQTDRLSCTLQLLIFHHAVAFLLLTHPHGGQCQVISPPQSVKALAGDDAILPCHVKPAANASGALLEWSRPDLQPKYVYVRQFSVDHVVDPNPSYQGRTSVSIDGLEQGDMSLKLSNVKLSDGGTYRCFSPELNTESNVQLVVDVIMEITKVSSGVLQCRSEGWHPEPEVVWLDGEGNLLPAEHTEILKGPGDLFTVSSRVTVEKTPSNIFTCRVHQRNINQIRETQVHVPDDFFTDTSSSSASTTVGLVVGIMFIIAVGCVAWRWRQNRKKTSVDEERGGEEETHSEQECLIGEDVNREELPAQRQTMNNQNKEEEEDRADSPCAETERCPTEEETQLGNVRTEGGANNVLIQRKEQSADAGPGTQGVIENRQHHEVQTGGETMNDNREEKTEDTQCPAEGGQEKRRDSGGTGTTQIEDHAEPQPPAEGSPDSTHQPDQSGSDQKDKDQKTESTNNESAGEEQQEVSRANEESVQDAPHQRVNGQHQRKDSGATGVTTTSTEDNIKPEALVDTSPDPDLKTDQSDVDQKGKDKTETPKDETGDQVPSNPEDKEPQEERSKNERTGVTTTSTEDNIKPVAVVDTSPDPDQKIDQSDVDQKDKDKTETPKDETGDQVPSNPEDKEPQEERSKNEHAGVTTTSTEDNIKPESVVDTSPDPDLKTDHSDLDQKDKAETEISPNNEPAGQGGLSPADNGQQENSRDSGGTGGASKPVQDHAEPQPPAEGSPDSTHQPDQSGSDQKDKDQKTESTNNESAGEEQQEVSRANEESVQDAPHQVVNGQHQRKDSGATGVTTTSTEDNIKPEALVDTSPDPDLKTDHSDLDQTHKAETETSPNKEPAGQEGSSSTDKGQAEESRDNGETRKTTLKKDNTKPPSPGEGSSDPTLKPDQSGSHQKDQVKKTESPNNKPAGQGASSPAGKGQPEERERDNGEWTTPKKDNTVPPSLGKGSSDPTLKPDQNNKDKKTESPNNKPAGQDGSSPAGKGQEEKGGHHGQTEGTTPQIQNNTTAESPVVGSPGPVLQTDQREV